MAQESLSIKLRELEAQITRLLIRIQLSENDDNAHLQQAIEGLKRECGENELALKNRLQLSRSGIVSTISHTYGQIETIIHQCKDTLQAYASLRADPDQEAEEKILLAEYALDFSIQAANRALLLAMEAMAAQPTQPEERRRTQ